VRVTVVLLSFFRTEVFVNPAPGVFS